MAGLALVALLAWAAWDVGRPGRASAPALLALRAIGGLGLVAMAAHALSAGAPQAALVAGAGACPLLLGLLGPLRDREAARGARIAERVPAPDDRAEVPEERRAA
jgi:hypothetical protein